MDLLWKKKSSQVNRGNVFLLLSCVRWQHPGREGNRERDPPAARVRRELWCGLTYLVIQTAGFMRLTFWELSWDVMEPICFYVTSMYFMAGYAFFLRTKKEPSFEGFFESRFAAKQKRVMRARGFDLRRYEELRRACGVAAPPLQARTPCASAGAARESGHCHSYCHCH
ncbi:Calcium uniporter protein 4 mitochondrial [Zea mays]|uniref:Calcium uniporter protein 4 mitochondrial n=1 Tax=Zea mays TaxID=4577 RepID=A0A1D6KRF7_MAIZE|nr:Calcium uniporter protein 4 mitochondrial [Zea mays]